MESPGGAPVHHGTLAAFARIIQRNRSAGNKGYESPGVQQYKRPARVRSLAALDLHEGHVTARVERQHRSRVHPHSFGGPYCVDIRCSWFRATLRFLRGATRLDGVR